MNNHFRNEILPLFLIVSFPINTWSIYIFFYNFEWVSQRTTLGDAIGYGAYALSTAFFESVLITLLILPFFLLLKINRDPETSKAVLGITYLMVSLWVIIGRISQSQDVSLISVLSAVKGKYHIHYRYYLAFIALAVGAISASMMLPPFWVNKYVKMKGFITLLFQRLELISYGYLVLNAIDFLIVVVRNLSKV
jgi:hypothetical protein